MSLQACAEITRMGDPDRFLSVMAAPPFARSILFPIYAFNVEIARAPWVTKEPMIAEMRLQWWQDALTEIAAGGPVRRHEVVDELAGVLPGSALGHLSALIEARRRDVHDTPFESKTEIETYLRDTSGGLMAAAVAALGGKADEKVLNFGQAVGLSNWLRALPQLIASGRNPLLRKDSAWLKELASDGLAMLAVSAKEIEQRAYPAARAGWLARSVLKKAVGSPDDILAGRLELSPFRKRAALLVTTLTGRI